MQGLLSLTQWGVDEVEAALAYPQQPTTFFPPVASLNIVVAESITNSPIQQGSVNGTQTVTVGDGDRETITTLLAELKATVAALSLTEDARKDAEAQLATVEAQLRASKPRRGIIRESLASLFDILKTAGAAASAVQGLKTFVEALG